MTLTITAQGLFFTLILVLFIIITVYLVKTLKNLSQLIENINVILQENKKSIEDSLENISQITSSAKQKVEYIDKFLNFNEVATTKDGADFISIIGAILSIINELKEFWTKKSR
ncbi:hypothetical protein SAMN05660865_01229 [Caloramator fervidus]|uniref:DUF948 domain-containing protein n=1 Tax=Caloramator fervidus TaxID=29344 RepID=A0A1H5VJY1_9CLOT|nr:hypothetical protein [Caloramator fervidus]SEF87503.1 hypothetical protein SAMN05660865_01229 [Caloramator fervidus]